MEFNFGKDNEPNPEEGNNFPFSFNPDNNGADTDGSVADNGTPFDWTPDDITNSDESDQNAISNDGLFNGETANEETPQFVPEVPDDMLEEVSRNIEEVSNDLFDESPTQEPAVEVSEADVFEAPAEEVSEADVIEEPAEEVSEADVFEEPAEEVSEADDIEEPAEEVSEADVFEAPAEDVSEPDAQMNEEVVSAPSALDKKVRTPDGEQEYLLSELIDVETGEPLDLTSLIPEELLSAATAPETTGGFSLGVSEPTTSGFSMGSAQPAEGGFDMSAGEEAPATGKRKRPARPKTEKKKGGGIVGVIMGGLLAVVLFPYVMAIIEMCGVESNFPVPAPFIPTSYKHIPDWWPEWAMFLFPGRTTTTDNAANTPADQPAKNPEPAVPEENANPADDSAAEEEAPADNAASADDGAFDPDAFLGNDGGAANDAQPEDNPADADEPAGDQPEETPADEPAADQPEEAPADEPVAEEPVEPGVIDAPQYTSADVSKAVAAVETAISAAKKIDDTVYAALNDMAEKSTFVDTKNADATLVESMDKVKKAMGKFGTNTKLASVLSKKWAARVEDASDNAGVLFVGTLTDVAQRNGYQINTITVEGQDGAVEVVGTRKIKPVVGDKIVVCGKRIADPAKNLGGFTDNGNPVVWGGIILKAVKENK